MNVKEIVKSLLPDLQICQIICTPATKKWIFALKITSSNNGSEDRLMKILNFIFLLVFFVTGADTVQCIYLKLYVNFMNCDYGPTKYNTNSDPS